MTVHTLPSIHQQDLLDDKWKQAMWEEMNALISKGTWEPLVPSHQSDIVGSRWVLIIKYKCNGTVEIYKAYLVAQGYTQTYVVSLISFHQLQD